ncbi:hypothetical protein VB796_07910 [Arcicella sp. LKC2W]|uniref:hypothetical protein n=1 Tax=Arcicella sp. LKC2W TaxID=2984198 RepID=UPI002B2074FF|nr:hypothetical protein [Arcicella sp. LKC2W]MEA5458957.1 hypothetical protein [Arcicella sp. LKC2W]
METQKTPLEIHIQDYELNTMLLFKPSRRFYESVGINKKRFWQLVRGTKKPLTEETNNLSKMLKVPFTELM